MVPYFLLTNNDDSLKGLWNDSEDLTRWNGSAWRILFINSIKHTVLIIFHVMDASTLTKKVVQASHQLR